MKAHLEIIIEVNFVSVGFDQRLQPVLKIIEDYKLDGVIAPRLGSCSMRTFFFDLVEAIEAKAGVPCVSFDSDLADSRMYSDEQVDRNIDAFFEILASRRQS